MCFQFQANGPHRGGVLMSMKAAWLILFAFSAIFCARGQESPLPRFEVASVKPIDLRARNAIDIKVAPGGRVIITAATLIQLIAGAYGGLQMYQISGPPWIASEMYDIQAEPPEDDYGKQPTTLVLGRRVPEIAALRLRALLIDRFHLSTHFEIKDHTVYDLITAKGGPKMKAGDPSAACAGGLMIGGGTFHSTSCSMAWFADRLARFAFQTDVFDKTGLAGVYDFRIDFTPTGPFAPASAESDSGTPSLFTALQGLGLKLEARKASMKMVIVDHVEKPGAN